VLSTFEKECIHNLDVAIKNTTSKFKDNLHRRFKKQFNRKDDGQPRDWKKMTEEEILHLFNQCKDETW
jgi:hypothetical protein